MAGFYIPGFSWTRAYNRPGSAVLLPLRQNRARFRKSAAREIAGLENSAAGVILGRARSMPRSPRHCAAPWESPSTQQHRDVEKGIGRSPWPVRSGKRRSSCATGESSQHEKSKAFRVVGTGRVAGFQRARVCYRGPSGTGICSGSTRHRRGGIAGRLGQHGNVLALVRASRCHRLSSLAKSPQRSP